METERFTAVSHFHFHPQPKFEYHFDGSTIKGFLERNFSASTFDFDSILEIWTPSNPPTREERYLLGTITVSAPHPVDSLLHAIKYRTRQEAGRSLLRSR